MWSTSFGWGQDLFAAPRRADLFRIGAMSGGAAPAAAAGDSKGVNECPKGLVRLIVACPVPERPVAGMDDPRSKIVVGDAKHAARRAAPRRGHRSPRCSSPRSQSATAGLYSTE